jgi:hypothetical protein
MAISFTQTAWNTAGTAVTNGQYKDITFTAAAGDLLVGFGISDWGHAAGGVGSVATQSGSTSAWTQLAALTNGNSCGFESARAVCSAGGSITARVTVSANSSAVMGVGMFVVPAAEWTGTPAWTTMGPADADGLISVAVADSTSIVMYLAGDWEAGTNPTGGTPSGATVDLSAGGGGGSMTEVALHWTGQASGTRNYGHSGGSGTNWSGGVLVVQEAGAATPYVSKIIVPGAAVQRAAVW